MNASTSQHTIQYAGFWRRLLALFLDIILFTILSAPIMYLLIGHDYFYWLAGNEDHLKDISSLPFVLHKLVFFIALFLFWKTLASTPGKLLMGCHIVDATTLGPITYKQTLIRLAGYFISALPLYLGFIWAARDKQKQGLHDKLANTLVIYHSDNYAHQSIEELETEFLENDSGRMGKAL